IALGSDLAEALAGYRAVRRIELRRVEQVVTLGPKLNIELVVPDGRPEVLDHDGIDIARVIVANIRRARPGGLNGERRRVDERTGIEPPRQARVIDLRAASEIVAADRDRLAALDADDTVEIPAAENRVSDRVPGRPDV